MEYLDEALLVDLLCGRKERRDRDGVVQLFIPPSGRGLRQLPSG